MVSKFEKFSFTLWHVNDVLIIAPEIEIVIKTNYYRLVKRTDFALQGYMHVTADDVDIGLMVKALDGEEFPTKPIEFDWKVVIENEDHSQIAIESPIVRQYCTKPDNETSDISVKFNRIELMKSAKANGKDWLIISWMVNCKY